MLKIFEFLIKIFVVLAFLKAKTQVLRALADQNSDESIQNESVRAFF